MLDPNPAVAVEGVRQFLKRHATCGGVFLDTPATPGGAGYRALAACRCGETAEYWLTNAVLSPMQFVEALSCRAPAAADAPTGARVRSITRAA